VLALIAVAAGMLAFRRLPPGAVLVVLFGAGGAYAVLTRPGSGAVAAAPSVAGTFAVLVTAWEVLCIAARRSGRTHAMSHHRHPRYGGCAWDALSTQAGAAERTPWTDVG
jgi:hypothetical protein